MVPEDIPSLGNPIDLVKISFGDVPGYNGVRKFGERVLAAADTQYDVWDFSEPTYTFTTTPQAYYISSDNGADTQTIPVEGLDDKGLKQIIPVTLDGLNKTLIGTGQLFKRGHRAFVDDSTSPSGNVYIYEDDTVTLGVPDTDSKVKAYIAIGNNQTQMAIYTIPSNKQGVAVDLTVTSQKKQAAVIIVELYIRPEGKVFRKVSTIGINTGGNGAVSIPIAIASVLSPMTDIVARATSDTVSAGVSVSFSIVERDN